MGVKCKFACFDFGVNYANMGALVWPVSHVERQSAVLARENNSH